MTDATHEGQSVIESRCSAVLETIERPIQKRKRGRPRSKKSKTKNIERMVINPLAVGRQTRMSTKVNECLEACSDKIDELLKKKKEVQRQLVEKKQAIDDAIETEQQKAADAVAASSLRMVDALQTKRANASRRKHVTQRAARQPRRKRIRKIRIPYTRTHLRHALECLVDGYKGNHPTLAAAKAAQSVRRAARLFMDGKHMTLGRILKKHDFVAKIETMSRFGRVRVSHIPFTHTPIHTLMHVERRL